MRKIVVVRQMLFMLIVAINCNLFAAISYFNGGGDGINWADPDNWTSDIPSGSYGIEAQFRYGTGYDVIAHGSGLTASKLYLCDYAPACSLTVYDDIYVDDVFLSGPYGTFNLENGTVNVARASLKGTHANINGGKLLVRSDAWSVWMAAVLNLNGGTMEIHNGAVFSSWGEYMFSEGGGVINFAGGELIMQGDVRPTIEGYVLSGNILVNGETVNDNLTMTYDGENTIISAKNSVNPNYFTATGDGVSWNDADNWSTEAVPAYNTDSSTETYIGMSGENKEYEVTVDSAAAAGMTWLGVPKPEEPEEPVIEINYELIESRLEFTALGLLPGDEDSQAPDDELLSLATLSLEQMNEDGSWSDIDYASTTSANWPGYEHYRRLMAMCQTGCRLPQGSPEAEEFITATHQAINFWKVRAFFSYNWWPHEIYIPDISGKLILMLGDRLSTDERDFLINDIMSKSTIKDAAQNRIWLSSNVFVRSLLTEDYEMAQYALDNILAEYRTATGEGMQADWSFHQHGHQLQWGNYGLHYIEDMTKWVWLISDTELEDNSRTELMRNYVLNGQAWVVWEDFYDITGLGRQIRPNETTKKANTLSRHMSYMKVADPNYIDDYQSIIDRVTLSEAAEPLIGNKFYWRSEYMSHRSQDIMATLKMSSYYVTGTEAGGNGENMLGLFLSDGALFVYTDSDRYNEIFPVWKWRQLPGTTLVQSTEPIPAPGWSNPGNMEYFVGGVSNNQDGCCAMDYNLYGLAAKKSWFMHNNTIVCLGAAINYSGANNVNTTIEQSLLNTSVAVDGGQTQTITTGNFNLEQVSSITHDGLVYSFPDNEELILECGNQTGSWWLVSRAESDEQITKDVFNLRINHGINPVDADYSYIIHPETEILEATEIIQNTGSIQAVMFEDTVMAVFYESGTLSFEQNEITVSNPCIVMLKYDIATDNYKLYVSEPTRLIAQININLVIDGQTYTETAVMPTGAMASSTVELQL